MVIFPQTDEPPFIVGEKPRSPALEEALAATKKIFLSTRMMLFG